MKVTALAFMAATGISGAAALLMDAPPAPAIDGKLAIEIIGLLVGSGAVGGGVGKYAAREAQRRADAALRRMDEQAQAHHLLELEHTKTKTHMEVLRDELSKLRAARHEEGNAINGWKLQHEERMDELKDRVSEIAGEIKARRP